MSRRELHITTEQYGAETVFRLIPLLVKKGVITPEEQKEIHDGIVERFGIKT